MSYEVKGKQYIAVNAGWNSAIVAKLTLAIGKDAAQATAEIEDLFHRKFDEE